MIITIMNWEKYNPKRDQSTYTWLRLNNDIYTDPKLFSLSPQEKWMWICLLCLASKENKGIVNLGKDGVNYLNHISGATIQATKVFLSLINDLGIATVNDRELSATLQKTTPTNERTNERTIVCDPFEKYFAHYPKRKGNHRKIDAFKKLKSFSDTELQKFGLALRKYSYECRSKDQEGTEFVMMFSSFVNSKWKNYLENDNPSTPKNSLFEESIKAEKERDDKHKKILAEEKETKEMFL